MVVIDGVDKPFEEDDARRPFSIGEVQRAVAVAPKGMKASTFYFQVLKHAEGLRYFDSFQQEMFCRRVGVPLSYKSNFATIIKMYDLGARAGGNKVKKTDDGLIASVEEDRRKESKESLRGVREHITRKKAEKAGGGRMVPLPLPDRKEREKVWVGPNFSARRIFVLGESWYGEYSDDLVTDDGYIRAYLDGRVPDRMYTRIAKACEMEKRQFWEAVMFTNFVQCVGQTRKTRPTRKHYEAAKARLEKLLEEHKAAGVWIIGIEQSKYSAPIVERAGIPYEVSPHTASFGLTNAKLGEGWRTLITKVAAIDRAIH